MKLLHVGFVVGTLGKGGAERQLFYMVRALREEGHKVIIFTLTSGEFWEGMLRKLGVDIVWFGKRKNRVARLLKLFYETMHRKPEIIQSTHFYTNLYVTLVGALTSTPCLGAARNDVYSEVADSGPWFGYFSLQLPTWIIVNSQQGFENALSQGVPRKRLILLRNVIDTDIFRPPKEKQIKRTFCFLFVGRLVKQKQPDLFLRVLKGLHRAGVKDFEGLIVGEGPLRQWCEKLVNDLGINEHVRFLGEINDMVEVYHAADVLVHTAAWEGCPNVVMEAMACGLPVVAAGVGEVPHLIRNQETGFVVTSNKEEDYVNVLLELFGNEKLRAAMGAAGRRRAVESWDSRVLGPQLRTLYYSVLSGKKGGLFPLQK